MSDIPELETILQQTAFKLSEKFKLLLLVGIGIGLIGLGGGLIAGSFFFVYRALLVNTLLFSGLAYGSVLFSAIFTLTKAEWARPLKRLAESATLFIPISWLLFGILMGGTEYIFAWTDPDKVIAAKRWWLNTPFFIARNSISIAATGLVGLAYVFTSLRPDLDLIEKSAPNRINRFWRWLSEIGPHINRQKHHDVHTVLAVLYVVCYTLSACQLGFDWIMSIDQEWLSSSFGLQYAVGNLFAAGAFLLILSSLVRRKCRLQSYFSLNRHHDLSRLVFAISMVWTFLVFCQVLVIWYANLPAETAYLMLRLKSRTWSTLAYFLFIALFLIPFLGLLSAKACRTPWFTSLIAGIVLVGLWWEKVFFVVPSLQHYQNQAEPTAGTDLTVWDVSITLGIAAAFLLALVTFLQNTPPIPLSDPLLSKADSGNQSTPVSHNSGTSINI